MVHHWRPSLFALVRTSFLRDPAGPFFRVLCAGLVRIVVGLSFEAASRIGMANNRNLFLGRLVDVVSLDLLAAFRKQLAGSKANQSGRHGNQYRRLRVARKG